jgi:deoxycytidine triphosphate deaminase
MILTGEALRDAAERALRPDVVPGHGLGGGRFGPISVDVHVGFADRRIVESGEHLVVPALEEVDMPTDLAAMITGRSTHMRSGLFMPAGWVDPGYSGELKLEFGNTSDGAAVIDGHEAAARLVFFQLDGDTDGYSGRYGER